MADSLPDAKNNAHLRLGADRYNPGGLLVWDPGEGWGRPPGGGAAPGAGALDPGPGGSQRPVLPARFGADASSVR